MFQANIEVKKGEVILTKEITTIPIGALTKKKMQKCSFFGIPKELLEEAAARLELYRDHILLSDVVSDESIKACGKEYDLSTPIIYSNSRAWDTWYVAAVANNTYCLSAIGANKVARTQSYHQCAEFISHAKEGYIPSLDSCLQITVERSFFDRKAVLHGKTLELII